MAMRTTSHNGRAGKKGVYSAKHNDRNFDPRKADHIDEERSAGNRYWHCYGNKHPEMTFEDAEAYYYERHFREALDERNERSIAQRHPERVKTMDDYRASKKTCPEETILQIGKAGETVDPALLWKVVVEHINWERETFKNCRLLDVALHVDEQGAPHIHERKVWIAHDEQGREVVGQAKALQEMGIERPDMSKAAGQHNNAKMTYTAECRAHLQEVARAHGLEIETEPLEHSKSGLALEEYKARQEQERAEQARQAARQAEQARESAVVGQQAAEQAQQMAERKAERARAQAERAARERDAAQAQAQAEQDKAGQAQREREQAEQARDRVANENAALNAQNARLSNLNAELDKKAAEIEKRALRASERATQLNKQADQTAQALKRTADTEPTIKRTFGGREYVPVEPAEYERLQNAAANYDAALAVLRQRDDIIDGAKVQVDRILRQADIGIRYYKEQAEKQAAEYKRILEQSKQTGRSSRTRARSRGDDGPGGRD